MKKCRISNFINTFDSQKPASHYHINLIWDLSNSTSSDSVIGWNLMFAVWSDVLIQIFKTWAGSNFLIDLMRFKPINLKKLWLMILDMIREKSYSKNIKFWKNIKTCFIKSFETCISKIKQKEIERMILNVILCLKGSMEMT